MWLFSLVYYMMKPASSLPDLQYIQANQAAYILSNHIILSVSIVSQIIHPYFSFSFKIKPSSSVDLTLQH